MKKTLLTHVNKDTAPATEGSQIVPINTDQQPNDDTRLSFRVSLTRGVEFTSIGFNTEENIALMKNAFSIWRIGIWLIVLLSALLFMYILTKHTAFIAQFFHDTS